MAYPNILRHFQSDRMPIDLENWSIYRSWQVPASILCAEIKNNLGNVMKRKEKNINEKKQMKAVPPIWTDQTVRDISRHFWIWIFFFLFHFYLDFDWSNTENVKQKVFESFVTSIMTLQFNSQLTNNCLWLSAIKPKRIEKQKCCVRTDWIQFYGTQEHRNTGHMVNG